MNEMHEYLRVLRLLRNAEDVLLEAGEDLPTGMDPLSAEPTDEHRRRASELMDRVLSGECEGIAEEKLMASSGAAFFRKDQGTQVDELLEAARKKAREQRAQERDRKARDDEARTKDTTT